MIERAWKWKCENLEFDGREGAETLMYYIALYHLNINKNYNKMHRPNFLIKANWKCVVFFPDNLYVVLIRREILNEETSPPNRNPSKSGTQHIVIQISRLSFLSFLQTISNRNYFASCSWYRTRTNSTQAYLVISYSYCSQKASRANFLTQREKPKLRVGLLCIFDDRGQEVRVGENRDNKGWKAR